MFKLIIKELKAHMPFTIFGALTGILVMFFCKSLSRQTAYNLFYIFHPVHVLLSGLATSAMYRRYKCATDRKRCNIFALLAVGYLGSIGIATLSDSIMPYMGEVLLNMPHREVHIGFIEKWWIVNPLAITGILIAYYKPVTKLPHYGHVLISTWASLFHILMAGSSPFGWVLYPLVFIFLFCAVWIPCCLSDIVIPLLFVKKEDIQPCGCSH